MSLAVVLVVAAPPGPVSLRRQLLLGLQQLQPGRQPVLSCPGLVTGHCSSIAAGTNVAIWRSKALAAPVRQPSAMDCDMGSGKMSSSPSSTPSKMARATDSGEVFGMSRPRELGISVSTGPLNTACTRTPRPASRARSACDRENAAALEIE